MMEGVLVQAVRLGAEEVSNEMQRFEPAGVTVLTGVPRARGFVLDGYGVFFDVEIPDMNQSVIWSMMNVQRDRQVGNALDSLRTSLESMPDGPNRQKAQMALQQLTKTVGPTRADARPAGPGRRLHLDRSAPRQPRLPDPDRLYSEAVKSALVEAMLDYSLQMDLGADEWLTVAARASEGPHAVSSGPVGAHHHRAPRQGQRPVDLSRRPHQARRDSPARESGSPRVLIYNPGHAGQGPPRSSHAFCRSALAGASVVQPAR